MKNLLNDSTRKNTLKAVRKQLGLTQAAMSEKLHISERAYGELERGRSGLSAATLVHFLMLLSDEGKLQFLKKIEKEMDDNDK